MADQKTPQNDKSKKTRSFGSFALFLFVLAAIFLFYGGNKFAHRRVDWTQDQYEWALYNGEVDSQEVKGPNVIEGTLKDPPKTEFSVSFADVGAREATLRELKAPQMYFPIKPADLQAAIDGGWYTPQLARQLTAYDEVPLESTSPVRKANDPAFEQLLTKNPRTDLLEVQVMAKPKSAWKDREGKDPKEDAEPPFLLPDSPGAVWLRVVDANDYGPLLGLLKSKSVPVDVRTFDIAKNKGTR